jgi:hypothetical protein
LTSQERAEAAKLFSGPGAQHLLADIVKTSGYDGFFDSSWASH